MEDKVYILKTTRGYHGDEDKMVNSLTNAFAEIMIEQIETKAKKMFIEAIHPKYRGRDVNIKFAKAFDNFLISADYKFDTETIENVIQQRNDAVNTKEELANSWSYFVETYKNLQISGRGQDLGKVQELISKISAILEKRNESN